MIKNKKFKLDELTFISHGREVYICLASNLEKCKSNDDIENLSKFNITPVFLQCLYGVFADSLSIVEVITDKGKLIKFEISIKTIETIDDTKH